MSPERLGNALGFIEAASEEILSVWLMAECEGEGIFVEATRDIRELLWPSCPA